MEHAAGSPNGPSTNAAGPARWLFGPAPDLLFGCGAAFIGFTALLLLTGSLNAFSPFAVAAIGLATNTPHYGATLLRVYEHGRDRRRYALFAVHATLAIFALFVAGLHWTFLGSLLLTVYVTWSPWHFAGQNYGLALMFLRRRGVATDGRTKRLLYASFVLSFLITLLILHGSGGDFLLAPVPEDLAVHYEFLSVGIPESICSAGRWIFGSAYLLVLIALAVSLLRRARAIDLVPSAMLVLLQAIWFSLPALVAATPDRPVLRLAIWVSAFHSIQYLWVTSYYARQTGNGAGWSYLGKTALAGVGVTMLPALLFTPAFLGTIPFDAGLGELLFACVNIHHFLLDGAIWKLRDGPVARALLRAEPIAAGPVQPSSGRARRLVWLSCAVGLVIYAVNAWEMEFGVRRPTERRDVARVETALERLRWIGRESHAVHYNLGFLLAQGDRLEPARLHLGHSIELYPTVEAWTALGNLERVEGRYAEALTALDAALALDPSYAKAHKRRGETLAAVGELELAESALDEAQRLEPDDPNVRASLRRLRRLREQGAGSPQAPESAGSGIP